MMERFSEKPLLPEIAPSFDQKQNVRVGCLLLAVVLLVVIALARPQWGYEWQEIKRQGLDILVAIDTSRSMLTQDVQPNRLERTKWAVKDLLKRLEGDRIGLIAFSGEAFLVCPLTVDTQGFLLSLEDLDTETIPRGGTDLEAAVREAIREYDEVPSKYKAVILLTDGENWEGDPLAAARKARDKGIRIYCIGIGTQEGELIRIPGASGKTEFLKDENGNFVKSRLDEKLLQEIALAAGGVYVRASGAQFGLELIYDQELSKLEKREIASQKEKRFHERFQIPLGLALILLCAETLLTNRKKRKAYKNVF